MVQVPGPFLLLFLTSRRTRHNSRQSHLWRGLPWSGTPRTLCQWPLHPGIFSASASWLSPCIIHNFSKIFLWHDQKFSPLLQLISSSYLHWGSELWFGSSFLCYHCSKHFTCQWFSPLTLGITFQRLAGILIEIEKNTGTYAIVIQYTSWFTATQTLFFHTLPSESNFIRYLPNVSVPWTVQLDISDQVGRALLVSWCVCYPGSVLLGSCYLFPH